MRSAPISSGQTLDGYTITGRLGAGGMGEVYRAHDSRLGRDVAIKVLPLELANDPDRLSRFDREARALAALNHPNIATIHGIAQTAEAASSGQASAVRAIVLELVEGPTLSERLARGPVPLDEALAIARQIAEALDAAHERGIVHRDLKPSNIKIRPDGGVKVLDFGLAKLVNQVDGTSGFNGTEPLAVAATQSGLVIGTTAYMSPEQARGAQVDKRTDIWAFGCVLYEMLAARPAFGGATTSDTMASVLEREPDWSAMSPRTPADVMSLVFFFFCGVFSGSVSYCSRYSSLDLYPGHIFGPLDYAFGGLQRVPANLSTSRRRTRGRPPIFGATRALLYKQHCFSGCAKSGGFGL